MLYSGAPDAFERHQATLAVLAKTTHLGSDPGLAALHDLALLSGMYGMFGGAAQALALVSSEKVSPTVFTADLLIPWLTAMLGSLTGIANDLEYGADPGTAGSNLAMQAAVFCYLLDASAAQGVDSALLVPMGELLRPGSGRGAR